MTLALLDADIIAFQAAAADQKTIDWGDGESVHFDLPSAVEFAKRTVAEWTSKAGCKDQVLCFSSKTNFRKSILPTYKANRKSEKPIVYWELVAALEAEFRSHRIEGLEADDTMGIMATSDKFSQSVIVSLDKDMQTLPARIFNPNKDVRPRQIRPQVADHYWMTQTLTGDTTDGYSGCPKVGPVNAEKILGSVGFRLDDMWSAVVEAFEAKGLAEDDALVQARVARILRRSDYNKQDGTIELWHPTRPTTLCLTRLTTPEASRPTATSAVGECPSPPVTRSSTSRATKTRVVRSKT
jgi:DNA polymerase-1